MSTFRTIAAIDLRGMDTLEDLHDEDVTLLEIAGRDGILTESDFFSAPEEDLWQFQSTRASQALEKARDMLVRSLLSRFLPTRAELLLADFIEFGGDLSAAELIETMTRLAESHHVSAGHPDAAIRTVIILDNALALNLRVAEERGTSIDPGLNHYLPAVRNAILSGWIEVHRVRPTDKEWRDDASADYEEPYDGGSGGVIRYYGDNDLVSTTIHECLHAGHFLAGWDLHTKDKLNTEFAAYLMEARYQYCYDSMDTSGQVSLRERYNAGLQLQRDDLRAIMAEYQPMILDPALSPPSQALILLFLTLVEDLINFQKDADYEPYLAKQVALAEAQGIAAAPLKEKLRHSVIVHYNMEPYEPILMNVILDAVAVDLAISALGPLDTSKAEAFEFLLKRRARRYEEMFPKTTERLVNLMSLAYDKGAPAAIEVYQQSLAKELRRGIIT